MSRVQSAMQQAHLSEFILGIQLASWRGRIVMSLKRCLEDYTFPKVHRCNYIPEFVFHGLFSCYGFLSCLAYQSVSFSRLSHESSSS